jgi:hypothetical protein
MENVRFLAGYRQPRLLRAELATRMNDKSVWHLRPNM